VYTNRGQRGERLDSIERRRGKFPSIFFCTSEKTSSFVIQSTFIMNEKISPAEDLRSIRKLMEESSKFLSLSGFSGIFMGLFSIAGAILAWMLVNRGTDAAGTVGLISFPASIPDAIKSGLLTDATAVLILSLGAALFFSYRKARAAGKSLWTTASRRLMFNLFIPLVSGGIFALILFSRGSFDLIIPVFLIFYGLGLINAGKFTYDEIFYLGLLEIATGLLAAIFPFLGLLFWVFGFGIYHMVYGIFMYRKYEA
jgi:hypothetical protein